MTDTVKIVVKSESNWDVANEERRAKVLCQPKGKT